VNAASQITRSLAVVLFVSALPGALAPDLPAGRGRGRPDRATANALHAARGERPNRERGAGLVPIPGHARVPGGRLCARPDQRPRADAQHGPAAAPRLGPLPGRAEPGCRGGGPQQPAPRGAASRVQPHAQRGKLAD